jgi:membrane protein DedA with SNARE-associated domain
LAFTGAATAIWCSLFAALGYDLGSRWSSDLRGVSDLGYGVAVFVVAIIVIAFTRRYRTMKRSEMAVAAPHDEPVPGSNLSSTDEETG